MARQRIQALHVWKGLEQKEYLPPSPSEGGHVGGQNSRWMVGNIPVLLTMDVDVEVACPPGTCRIHTTSRSTLNIKSCDAWDTANRFGLGTTRAGRQRSALEERKAGRVQMPREVMTPVAVEGWAEARLARSWEVG